tara:strand:- start:12563 stop:12850 length:288 start_codon:yes stop_codon:yes gene_type:complete
MANFAVKLRGEYWLSFFQEPYNGYDADEGMYTCEVALMNGHGNDAMVGEPVRFSDAEELIYIMASLLAGDEKLFRNQYTFEFDMTGNDNKPVNQT